MNFAERIKSKSKSKINEALYHAHLYIKLLIDDVCLTNYAQAKEVQENEAGCRIYFAMTKCDLLEHMPNVGVQSVAEASPSGGASAVCACSAAQSSTDIV